MGCVSSNLLSNEDDFPQLGSSALGHHIVSLTSSTYGLLNLDPPTTTSSTPPTPPLLRPRDADVINSWDLMSGLDAESFRFPAILSGKARNFVLDKENFNPNSTLSRYPFQPRVLLPLKEASFSENTSGFVVSKLLKDCTLSKDINEFDGFHVPMPMKDASFGDSASGFEVSKLLKDSNLSKDINEFDGFHVPMPLKDASFGDNTSGFEVSKVLKDYNLSKDKNEFDGFHVPMPLKDASFGDSASGFGIFKSLKEDGVCSVGKFGGFRDLCPPNGENKVVIYMTSLRGIRKTFEDCNAVRSAIEGFGFAICERDVSMDRGFREELRELMERMNEKEDTVLPRVFVKGKYIGGVEEVMRMVEEGWMEELLKELPKKRVGELCEGCGNARFLPCFSCNGSCKMVINVKEEAEELDCRDLRRNKAVVRCPDCNENGLVLCPICS